MATTTSRKKLLASKRGRKRNSQCHNERNKAKSHSVSGCWLMARSLFHYSLQASVRRWSVLPASACKYSWFQTGWAQQWTAKNTNASWMLGWQHTQPTISKLAATTSCPVIVRQLTPKISLKREDEAKQSSKNGTLFETTTRTFFGARSNQRSKFPQVKPVRDI